MLVPWGIDAKKRSNTAELLKQTLITQVRLGAFKFRSSNSSLLAGQLGPKGIKSHWRC